MRLFRTLSLVLICATAAFAATGTQLRQLAMVYIPGNPGFHSIAVEGGFLIIAHDGAGTVDVFNARKRRLVSQIEVGRPRGMAVDAATGKIYVTDAAAPSVMVISTKNWKAERTIPLKLEPGPVVLSSNGKKLYIGNVQDQSISALDLSTNQVSTQPLNGHPDAIAYDPSHDRFYVSLEDQNQVAVVDPDLKVLQRYSMTASQPTALALDPQARRLYVAVRSAVLALNADTGAELGRVPAPPGVDSLWLDRTGGRLYLSSSNEVGVVRASATSFATEDQFPLKVRGHGIAFDPDRQQIYMPAAHEGRSLVLILKSMQGVPQQRRVPAEALIH
ncbi:MAG TPA: YncE family protein [Terriglobales bacterium]|nr:YncE family protein [Terriglobales bacterium]